MFVLTLDRNDKGFCATTLLATRQVILSEAKNPENNGSIRASGIVWILRHCVPQNDSEWRGPSNVDGAQETSTPKIPCHPDRSPRMWTQWRDLRFFAFCTVIALMQTADSSTAVTAQPSLGMTRCSCCALARNDKGICATTLLATRQVILSAAKNPENNGSIHASGIVWILRHYVPQNDSRYLRELPPCPSDANPCGRLGQTTATFHGMTRQRVDESCAAGQAQISRITGRIMGRRLVFFWMKRFKS